jgi:hypothetical protein
MIFWMKFLVWFCVVVIAIFALDAIGSIIIGISRRLKKYPELCVGCRYEYGGRCAYYSWTKPVMDTVNPYNLETYSGRQYLPSLKTMRTVGKCGPDAKLFKASIITKWIRRLASACKICVGFLARMWV